MKPNTRIAIASLLSAAGSLLNAFAAEFGGEAPEAATPADAPAPKRGKKTTEKPVDPPAETATTETAATVEEPATTAAPTTPAGDITNPKYEEHRALIAPLVQGDQSTAELRAQVKKVVEKYSPNGGLKVMPEKNHAAFEKDIASLSY